MGELMARLVAPHAPIDPLADVVYMVAVDGTGVAKDVVHGRGLRVEMGEPADGALACRLMGGRDDPA